MGRERATAIKKGVDAPNKKNETKTQRSPTLRQKVEFVSSFYPLALLPHVTNLQSYWSTITDGLILSALPLTTKLRNHGDHGNKLIAECKSKKRPLSTVYSMMNSFEFEGKGLIGIQTVTQQFWQDKKIQHHLVPMDDNSDNLNIGIIKKIVDDINKEIKANKTVCVHCNTGKGRSLTIIACYLLIHSDMDVTQALAFIHKKRPQVSISTEQLELIELFREAYCPHKTALNDKSQLFEPFRKLWQKLVSSPLAHASLGQTLAYFFNQSSWSSLLFSTAVGGASYGGQQLRRTIGNHAYTHLDKQYTSFADEEKRAFKTGVDCGESWQAWFSHLTDTNAILHYSSYLAGVRARQENHPLCEEITQEKKVKIKVKGK